MVPGQPCPQHKLAREACTCRPHLANSPPPHHRPKPQTPGMSSAPHSAPPLSFSPAAGAARCGGSGTPASHSQAPLSWVSTPPPVSAPACPLRPGSLGACCSWHRELVLPLPWLAQTGLRLRPSQSPAPSHRLAYFPPSSLAGKFNRHTDTWDAVQQQGYFSLEAFTHMLSQAGAVALCCCVALQPTSCWHQHAGTHVQPGRQTGLVLPAKLPNLCCPPAPPCAGPLQRFLQSLSSNPHSSHLL